MKKLRVQLCAASFVFACTFHAVAQDAAMPPDEAQMLLKDTSTWCGEYYQAEARLPCLVVIHGVKNGEFEGSITIESELAIGILLMQISGDVDAQGQIEFSGFKALHGFATVPQDFRGNLTKDKSGKVTLAGKWRLTRPSGEILRDEFRLTHVATFFRDRKVAF